MPADHTHGPDTVLLDTSILIDVLRGNPHATNYLNTLTQPPISSEICRVELLQGLRQHEHATANALIDLIEWYPIFEPVSTLAGELGRQWRPSHTRISAADLIIAATTQLTNTRLATHNIKHFPMIDGLTAPY